MKLHSILFLSLASVALAAPSWWEQWSIGKPRNQVSHDENLRLVQTSEDEAPFWTTESERLAMFRNRVGYMDITDNQNLGSYHANALGKKKLPTAAVHQTEVARYIDQISTENMKGVLEGFTSFYTRYYKSKTGYEAASWLYAEINDLIKKTDADSNVGIREFEHPWGQFSIIVRFEGSDETLINEPVIVGAHLDSVNFIPSLAAPGADDDGSGTVTILEIFRALVNTGFKPFRPVEFHWYSAEEAGLLGSQAIAQSYEENGVEVLAMIQNDMTGYVGPKFPESYGLIVDDYVDAELTQLVRVYAEEYGQIPVLETKCGYGCSDHASWTKAGYRSAFAIEGESSNNSPYVHSAQDDVSHINYEHMKQFARLSLGFAVELGYYKGQ